MELNPTKGGSQDENRKDYQKVLWELSAKTISNNKIKFIEDGRANALQFVIFHSFFYTFPQYLQLFLTSDNALHPFPSPFAHLSIRDDI